MFAIIQRSFRPEPPAAGESPEQPGPPVVQARGVVTVDDAEALDRSLREASGAGADPIYVDLSATELLGAAAMGVIVGRRHQLTLLHPTIRLANQLRLVGLDRALQIRV